MWMSSMTSGVKIPLRPRMSLREGVPSIVRLPLEHELALGRLEVVVVVEHLAADELLELGRRAEIVDAELALDELRVGLVPLAGDAVDPERADLPGDVDLPVVHRVAEAVTDVAADDLAAALHHEPGHRAGVAEDDDRAALLVDAGAGSDLALDDDVAAANGGRRQRARVALDHDDARHHVLAGRPADPPGDADLGTVDEAAAEVAQAAFEVDLAAGEDPDAQRVLRARVQDRHLVDAFLVQEPAQLEVDLPGGEIVRVERCDPGLDRRRPRRLRERLGEPSRVVRDPALPYGRQVNP